MTSRHIFVLHVFPGASVVLATLRIAPTEVARLSQLGPAALTLSGKYGDKYGDKYGGTKIDSKKYPNYAAGRHCANDGCLARAGKA